MSGGEFVTSVITILTVMALICAVEIVVPLFPRRSADSARTMANFGLTAIAFVASWAFTSAVAVFTITEQPGLMTRLSVPTPAQIVITIVVLDFCFGYLAHVALHLVPRLWRVHAVHHSDAFVDVTTTYRTHPIEVAWRSLFMIPPVWILGVPPGAFVAYRLLSAMNGMLEHANLRVWPALDRILVLLWVTPHMHKIHHSRQRSETNSNYGNLLSIYDRAFRTFISSEGAASVVFGLEKTDPDAVRSLSDLLSMRLQVNETHDREVVPTQIIER